MGGKYCHAEYVKDMLTSGLFSLNLAKNGSE